ncbi:YjcG family protein [Fredinandcohnia quinoae]|uniref:Putative phosphoesterase MJG50_13085 n=1 Tax=Fredinandcohnia quinoae TaxID=2918902 RepID=A0AAW5EAT7_9BACI|nr:YjcG family protein [Fredinandcohnia sp. SECRCQ15]MCH1626268.1 YjcG family protein [Fredinandcohnia sp. SECRCQ15]
MKYGIALFPSKKLQDLVNSYRKRYDPHYALIPPHLTLKNSFEASDSEIKDIAKQLDAISDQANPFPLKITKVSSFYPVNNVIYLKVEPNEQLSNLHESLHSGFFSQESEYSFVPHITIGQRLSDDEHSDVLGQLRMHKVKHEEEIDRFHLLYQLENGMWTVYETFLLGKES